MCAKHQAALDCNTALLQQSDTIHHQLGPIIGKRFIGRLSTVSVMPKSSSMSHRRSWGDDA